MHIHGSPICKSTASETSDLTERFWRWRGASGQNYIHSVYKPGCCPPLPGAVYVGVKRVGSARVAVHVGRFAPSWDSLMPCEIGTDFRECDEVHVHLLARSAEAAETICRDLAAALGEESTNDDEMPQAGSSETRGFPKKQQGRFSFAA